MKPFFIVAILFSSVLGHHHDQRVPIMYAMPPEVILTQEHYSVSRKKFGKVIDQSPPTYYCKDPRFTLEGHKCVRLVTEPVVLICPPGYVKGHDGECFRKSPVIKSCKHGFHPHGDHCEKIVTVPIEYVCPEGTTQTGPTTCEKEVPAPIIQKCDRGILTHGHCVFKNYVPAVGYCPPGFEFINNACIKEISYDCTHSHQPYMAELRRLDGIEQSSAERNLGDCDPRTGLCGPPHELPHMEKTKVTVQKTCTKVTTSSLIYECPEGVIQDTQCCIEEHIPPISVCTGHGTVEHCCRIIIVPAIAICPPGFTKECSPYGPCRCVAVETAPYCLSCPPGYYEEGDYCVITAPAIPTCPPGYHLEHDICIKKIIIDADCMFSVQYECDHHRHECD